MNTKDIRFGNSMLDRFGNKTKILGFSNNDSVFHEFNDVACSLEFMTRIRVNKSELQDLGFLSIRRFSLELDINHCLQLYSCEPFEEVELTVISTGEVIKKLEFVDQVQNILYYLK